MVFMWRRYMPTRTGLRTPSPAPTTGHRRETKPVAMRGRRLLSRGCSGNEQCPAGRAECQTDSLFPGAEVRARRTASRDRIRSGPWKVPPTGVQAPPSPETISCRMKAFRECICDCGQTVPMTAIRDFHALIASFWPRARVFSTGEPQMRRRAGGFYSAGVRAGGVRNGVP